jgi:hypothetical protein
MTNRRDFLKSAGRSFLLALTGFGIVYGFRQKKITTQAKAACEMNPGCQGCGKLEGCNKKQADEFRGAGKKKPGKGN